MEWTAERGRLARLFGLVIVAAALSGCGGGGDSAASDTAGTSTVSSDGSGAPTGVSTSLVALSASQYTVAPASTAVLTIYRTGAVTGSATVAYTTVDGTATAGVDYTATTGSVTWEDGDSSAKTVAVPVMNAARDKSFALALTSVEGNADFGTPAAATVLVTASTAAAGGASSSSGSSSGGASSSSGSSSGGASSSSGSSSGGASSSGSSGSSSSGSSSSSGGKSTSDSVTLSWLAPSGNTNGTALTNLAGFNIYYGTSATAMTQKISIHTVGVLTYVISNLSAGTWYFAVTSINAAGVESSPSPTVSATI
jgi:hypothetical protein